MDTRLTPAAARALDEFESGRVPTRAPIRRPAWKLTRSELETLKRARNGQLKGTKVA